MKLLLLLFSNVSSSLVDVCCVCHPGEGGTEEIGNMIQGYIKEIEDLR